MTAIHPELDVLTEKAVELADEYARKLTALEKARFQPPGEVVPVDGGYRVHLPGRTPRTTEQLAQLYRTKGEARAVLRAIQGGGSCG